MTWTRHHQSQICAASRHRFGTPTGDGFVEQSCNVANVTAPVRLVCLTHCRFDFANATPQQAHLRKREPLDTAVGNTGSLIRLDAG